MNEELKKISELDYIDWNVFRDKNIFVTGMTGLIGSAIVKTLLYVSEKYNLNLNIIGLVRSVSKAKNLFDESNMKYYEGDLHHFPEVTESVDYVIHCANPTSSQFFVNQPVETIRTAMEGVTNVLELAKNKAVESMVFLSTMEVHGIPEKGHKVKVEEGGSFDTQVVRNCYPLSKQLCENLCVSYASEYDVNAKVLRLTQTFGPGVSYNDGRVFAEFARCAIEKRNIVLKTKGETERDYLYLYDAVTATIVTLLKGAKGNVYTAANEATYCSIYEMAKMVANKYGIEVIIEEQDTSKFGYANTLYMDLDTSKLQALGWKAETDLMESFDRLIESMKENK